MDDRKAAEDSAAAGTWLFVSPVPECTLRVGPTAVGRVLKRDYNYFDGLNESLRKLAERERMDAPQ
jgi:hypothetical protein